MLVEGQSRGDWPSDAILKECWEARAETGTTPARAVERLRVEAARGLLVDAPRLPAKRVAARCGFGSEETMRRAFLRVLATTPQGYRERFADGAPGGTAAAPTVRARAS